MTTFPQPQLLALLRFLRAALAANTADATFVLFEPDDLTLSVKLCVASFNSDTSQRNYLEGRINCRHLPFTSFNNTSTLANISLALLQ